MQAQVSILLDLRREKGEALYPLKLRVYYRGRAVLHPTVYDLSKIDYDKLEAKRVSYSLSEIREKIYDIEFKAKVATKEIVPFDPEKFYETFIRGNVYFRNRNKPAKWSGAQKDPNDVPEEWKRKFAIFKELQSGLDQISAVYLVIIRSLLYQARVGTADSYQSSYNSLKAFRGNVRVSDITPQF